MKRPDWRCWVLLGHKYRTVVTDGVSYLRCARCGKERDKSPELPYSGTL